MFYIPNKRNVDSSACPDKVKERMIKYTNFFEITKIPKSNDKVVIL